MFVFEFLASYSYIVLPAVFLTLIIFAIVNWSVDPYRSHNKKTEAYRRKISAYPEQADKYSKLLPQEYRRQWRAYINTNADRPSQAFEFVKRKNKTYLLRELILAAMVLALYVVCFIFCSKRMEFIVSQFVFYVAFAFSLVIKGIIFKKREKRARQTFARMVAELNAAAKKSIKAAGDSLDSAVKKLNELNKGDVTKSTLDKAGDILRGKGLDGNRTVAEQRKLNTALNGLLQAYSRNAKLNV